MTRKIVPLLVALIVLSSLSTRGEEPAAATGAAESGKQIGQVSRGKAENMSIFAAGHRSPPWVWQVTALCFILGVLLASSLQTVRHIKFAGVQVNRVGYPSPVARVVTTPAQAVLKHEEEINRDLFCAKLHRLQKKLCPIVTHDTKVVGTPSD